MENISVYNRILTCEVSPSGRYLAAGDDQGHLALFDIQQERFLAKYNGHTQQITRLRWSQDEKSIVSVALDASVVIWNFFPE